MRNGSLPLQQGEYPVWPEPAIFDGVDRSGNPVSHGYSATQVNELLDAARGAAQAAPAVTLPAGWVPLTITHEGGHPEEVAFGPQRMMDRLNKWLDRYFAMLAAPAPVAEDAAYTELHGQINYIAAYSVDALDALDRDRLLGFARSLVRRAQTSLEIANLARAQAAQPEGGA